MNSHNFARIPQLYNSVRYEQKPRRWMVRYYDMYPLDPQGRLTIKRAVVTAKTSDEAADIMAVCGKEIIDVELYNLHNR